MHETRANGNILLRSRKNNLKKTNKKQELLTIGNSTRAVSRIREKVRLFGQALQ